ncbi:MAG: serine/threonine protein kinase, partial [Gemmatimonadetes bacterium]|nr:serine/threonine protein kinase [Gemmatimonadota bacterium]
MTADASLAIRQAARGQFDVLGELGRGELTGTHFLARELTSGDLVALGFDPAAGAAGIRVSRTLDASVPAAGAICPICATRLQNWGRYCGRCGTDLAVRTAVETRSSRAELRRIVQRQVEPRYELLGDMVRAEGGAPVYFALDPDAGDVVALTLEEATGGAGGAAAYSVNVTSTFRSLRAAEAAAHAKVATPVPEASTNWHGQERTPSTGGTGPKVCPVCGTEYGPNIGFCPKDGSVLRSTSSSDDLVGQILAERYQVQKLLGEGGMGRVFLAEHVRMARRCAIKVLHKNMSTDTNAVRRFGREATNAGKINHPNVIDVYDFGETHDGLVYLAMEYVDGESLTKVLEREAPLPVARAVDIASQVAAGLAAAHRIGVVHRDLKPDNILLTASPEGGDLVKVVDFGIAKAMEVGDQDVTRTGMVVGTPDYMSPEQLIADPVDARSDLYSLGMVIYTMLVGARAFSGPSREKLVVRRLTEPPPHPNERRPDLPEWLDAVVVKLLARAPGDRYQTAEEFRTALLAGERKATEAA